MRLLVLFAATLFLLPSCSNSGLGGVSGPGNMGSLPSPSVRQAQIASEPKGNFFYGRRYYVEKTRFWGYLREPGKPATTSRLVIMNETRKRCPDRLPEYGPGKRYAFDNNYEYRIYGRFTGEKRYEPNSNQFLPEFLLTDYKLVSKNPGWLFSPYDRYDPKSITLRPSRY